MRRPSVSTHAGTAKVQLRIQKKAEWGESLAVVGSLPSLGDWKEKNAYVMQWTEGHVWIADLEVPQG